jgi:hypothetical protein
MIDLVRKKMPVDSWARPLEEGVRRDFPAEVATLPGVHDLADRASEHLLSYIEYRYGDGEKPIVWAPFSVRHARMIYPTYRATFYAEREWCGRKSRKIEGVHSLIVVLDTLIDCRDSFPLLLRYLVLSDRRDMEAVVLAGFLFGLLYRTEVPSSWLVRDDAE